MEVRLAKTQETEQPFLSTLYALLQVLRGLSGVTMWVMTEKGFRAQVHPHGEMSPTTFVAYHLTKKVIATSDWRQAARLIRLPEEIAARAEGVPSFTDKDLALLMEATGLKEVRVAQRRELAPEPPGGPELSPQMAHGC